MGGGNRGRKLGEPGCRRGEPVRGDCLGVIEGKEGSAPPATSGEATLLRRSPCPGKEVKFVPSVKRAVYDSLWEKKRGEEVSGST